MDAQNQRPHRERFLHGGEDRPRGRVITLIHGGESYLVDRATRDLLQPLRAGLTLEFNYEDLQADSLSADAFAEKAGTLPFIDALRVLVLRNWGLLAGKRDKGAGAERAAAYMEGIPDTTQLVLVVHALVGPGNPIYKTVVAMERDKRARVIRHEPPRRSDRAGWVRKLAEERGLTITPAAVRLLLERADPDLRLLEQEIVKLALFALPSTRIDEDAVRALVSDSREEEIFALTDALRQARPGDALRAAPPVGPRRLGAQARRGTGTNDHAGRGAAPARTRRPRPATARAGNRQACPLCAAVHPHRRGRRARTRERLARRGDLRPDRCAEQSAPGRGGRRAAITPRCRA
ncbi:MAG: DNA polymerase III subunit delta [Chloroflexi bacterium]|nr:MAG: DNA polymerase III subunit delta [Chloroflexota bacterium]